MNGEIFIPIVMFLVIGAIFISWFYYRSKEKQIMIEKGMDYEQMMEFYKSKRKFSPYILLNIGIILICFSVGLGVAMAVEEYGGPNAFVAAPIFLSIGIGFVLTFVVSKYFQKNEDNKN